jgi:hypothetical protein
MKYLLKNKQMTEKIKVKFSGGEVVGFSCARMAKIPYFNAYKHFTGSGNVVDLSNVSLKKFMMIYNVYSGGTVDRSLVDFLNLEPRIRMIRVVKSEESSTKSEFYKLNEDFKITNGEFTSSLIYDRIYDSEGNEYKFNIVEFVVTIADRKFGLILKNYVCPVAWNCPSTINIDSHINKNLTELKFIAGFSCKKEHVRGTETSYISIEIAYI